MRGEELATESPPGGGSRLRCRPCDVPDVRRQYGDERICERSPMIVTVLSPGKPFGRFIFDEEAMTKWENGGFNMAGTIHPLIYFLLLLVSAMVFAGPLNGQDDVAWREKAHAAVKAAIPQAEKDPTRPVYHFRPPAQWMNDICGAVYYRGYYHAFYQLNPFSGDEWSNDNIVWAHARSKDLVFWEDLPWAVVPMTERGERRCNSGCVALDGYGQPMIFYTCVPSEGKRNHWGLKPLDTDLIKWKRVSDKPLMAPGKNGVPAGVPGGWSDPFVFEFAGRRFVTFKSANGLVCEAQDLELTQWKFVGRLDGISGECPNLFPLDQRWVLIRSEQPTSYLVGDFDANDISLKATAEGVFDYGFGENPPTDRSWTRGLYGTNTFVDKDGRRILLGWICGFRPKRGWNGCMSLPRVLTIDENQRLVQSVAHELKQLRGKHESICDLELSNESKRVEGVRGDTLEIRAEFVAGDAAAFGLRLRESDDGRRAILIRYEAGVLNVSGTAVPLELDPVSPKLTLHVFIDKSVMEVFVNGGVMSVTRVEYPGEYDLGVSIFAEEGAALLKSLDVWKMNPIW
jgi:beta-fructofuranosidase